MGAWLGEDSKLPEGYAGPRGGPAGPGGWVWRQIPPLGQWHGVAAVLADRQDGVSALLWGPGLGCGGW